MSNFTEPKLQEEDASILKFPKGYLQIFYAFFWIMINNISIINNEEFENVETLLISEVKMLMEQR